MASASCTDFLKPLMAFPSPSPNCGSLPAPKIIKTMKRIRISSVNPILPNIVCSSGKSESGCARFTPFGKPFFQPLTCLLGLLEHFALVVDADQIVIGQRLVRIVLDGVFHDLDGQIRLLMIESQLHQLETAFEMLWVQLEGAEITLDRRIDRVVVGDLGIVELDVDARKF